MKVFVDADACPVVKIVEKISKDNHVPAVLLCDTNHVMNSEYSEVCVIGAGADAVDFALISKCHAGDVVVTQDYGVAAMALGKKAYAIHQSGKWYTDANIDQMLMERHLAKKARRGKTKNHMKGPRKRTEEDDEHFTSSFQRLLAEAANFTGIITRIEEPDFGCEGRPEGQPVLCPVEIQDPSGRKHYMEIEEHELYEKKIDEGMSVEVKDNGLCDV